MDFDIVIQEEYLQFPVLSRAILFEVHMEMTIFLNILVHHCRSIICIPWMEYSGFISFFEQNIQGLFKDFQGHTSHVSNNTFNATKSLESVSFLVLPQHEQFSTEDLSVFAPIPLDWIKLATKFKDFPALTAVFKDFQGVCEPWILVRGVDGCPLARGN